MRTVADVLAVADRVAPLARAASWDPVGLQLGDTDAVGSTVGVCHEVTDEVVEAVIAAGLDVLVSYHPLLFRPMRSLTAGRGPNGRAFRLIRAGVSLIVVHTAADAAGGGAAESLAVALGLGRVKPFGPMWPADSVKIITFAPADHVDALRTAMAGAGAGTIGHYTLCSFEMDGHGTFVPGTGATPFSGTHGVPSRDSETRVEMVAPAGRTDAVVAALVAEHPYDEPAYDVIATRSNAGFVGRHGALATSVERLADLVEERLGSRPKVAGKGSVERVAVVPGSGGDFVAAAAGVADVVVTGDVSHHQAGSALDLDLAVIDPGHAATERPGVASLYASLAAELGDIVDLTGIPASPWKDG